MRLDPIKLQNKINRLEELFSQIISGLKEDRKLNKDATAEYRGLKKEILLSLFKEPIHHTDDRYFPEVRRILQRLTLDGDPYISLQEEYENENSRTLIESFHAALDIDLSEEIRELELDEFYSWFSGEDYVLNKIKGQLLILQTERLPQFLSNYTEEIRECFVFQRYLAASVLCRTVFEIAVRDLVSKKRLLHENSENWWLVKNYVEEQLDKFNRSLEKYVPTLEVYIDLLTFLSSFQGFKDRMHHLRSEGNSIIHANRILGRKECQKMIRETFLLIHELYESA